jgi:hypothetical protein
MEAKRAVCAKMAHWRLPLRAPVPHLSPSVPPPYPLPTPSLPVSGPKVRHFGTVRGVHGTRKQFGIAEFRGKAFRLTLWMLNWAGIVRPNLAVLTRLWSAPAERSGDGALAWISQTAAEAKAGSRFACPRSPYLYASLPDCTRQGRKRSQVCRSSTLNALNASAAAAPPPKSAIR